MSDDTDATLTFITISKGRSTVPYPKREVHPTLGTKFLIYLRFNKISPSTLSST
jgi:hypothetical protein